MTIFLKKEEILIFSLYFLELMTKAFLILMQLPKSFKQIKSLKIRVLILVFQAFVEEIILLTK